MTNQTRMIDCNGLRMRIAEAGTRGEPLVILAHGWPESWYSWRHQLPALARAGYHVVAPDMRGFGSTDAPLDVREYDILQLVADLVGIVDEAGADQAVVVGHDWGSVAAWHAALLNPERFRAVVAMSVPYFGRSRDAPTRIWKQRHGDTFYYILYHQTPGRAEAEYDTNPEGLLRMLYASPDSPRAVPTIKDPHKDAGGWIGRWGQPGSLPEWLSEEDLAYYIREFERAGFRGGLNYYRNLDRNWELLKDMDQLIPVPALFIVGAKDLVIAGMDQEMLEGRMGPVVPELRPIVWLEGAGHWIQQERAAECNRALLEFLDSLD
jgi:pimeloyl-ACP methyl ester carboxylesterase